MLLFPCSWHIDIAVSRAHLGDLHEVMCARFATLANVELGLRPHDGNDVPPMFEGTIAILTFATSFNLFAQFFNEEGVGQNLLSDVQNCGCRCGIFAAKGFFRRRWKDRIRTTR